MERWPPTASLETLIARSEILRRVREFFFRHDFIEVETPILSHDTVVDVHIEPVRVSVGGQAMWLQTSPEFSMKRLLTAGMTSIFQVSRAFREAEVGTMHNPEFTMVEWYRAGHSYAEGRDFLADFCVELLKTEAVEQISYAQAFVKFVGLNPHQASIIELATAAKQRDVLLPQSLASEIDRMSQPGSSNDEQRSLEQESCRDELLNVLLAELVEPNLGVARPTILFDYPASQAALAQVRNGEYNVAERFELYVNGVELANGYHELLDANELLRRNVQTNRLREQQGRQSLPCESQLVEAMQHGMPPCSGVALGFDRLVMLALEKKTLAEVIAFPIDRA